MEDNQTNKEFEAAFAPAPSAPAAATPMQQPMAAPVNTAPVNVFTPEGDLVAVSGDQLQEALGSGYREASSDEVNEHLLQKKYGSAKDQAITALEGAGSAATFGLSTGLETALGVNPEDIRGRREANPISHGAGQVAGLVGTSLIPGLGEANAAKAMETAGMAGAKALGLGAAETTATKIGSAAVKGVIENAIFQSGDEVSKMLSKDPTQSIQTAAADVGLAGLIGGTIGAGIGAASPLWHATVGKELTGTTKAIVDRLGGIDGQIEDPIGDIALRAGVDLPAAVKAGLSDDPNLRNAALQLAQSDTTRAGNAFQQDIQSFRSAADDSMITALGHNPATVDKIPELSKYESGKKLGKTLADEFEAKVNPIAEEFNAFKNKYKNLELDPSVEAKGPELQEAKNKALNDLAKKTKAVERALKSSDPGAAVEASAALEESQAKLRDITAQSRAPGTVDKLSEQISRLAESEGWAASPSSDIMQEIGRIQKELPLQKNLKNLGDYISAVGSNMQSDPMNGPLRRAGGMIKSLMKDAEGEVLAKHVGKREGTEALGRYQLARQAYAETSGLKEALDSRLHVKGSTSSYAKALREAANTDGEAVLRKLSGNGDADLLKVLQDNFPKTADALKQHHLNDLMNTAASKAKPGEKISTNALRNAIDKMSPELRSMVLSPEQIDKIGAVSHLLDRMKDSRYNFSNTGRTIDKLTGHIPGGVVGLVTALTTGSIGAGAAAVAGTKALTKGIPDEMRYALLKFLGTNKPIEPAALGTLVETIKSTIRGENMLAKASKNVFKASEKAAISLSMPTERDRKKLDQMVMETKVNPNKLLDTGSKVSYYAPEMGTATAATSVNALNFLASQRPDNTPKMPLDSKLPPDPGKQANYDRMLNIATKPLILMDKIKAGSITSQEITGLKTMYPGLYNNMVQKLTMEMNDSLSKGNAVPYSTRIGLSMFSGMPMDSTMTPHAIISAQPKPPAAQPPQGAPNQQKPPSASSTKGISKMPASYQTAEQAREQRSQKQ